MTTDTAKDPPQSEQKTYLGLPDRTIVLVGLMGSGKSTIGRRLAARIGWAFRDADEEIEKAANMSIADIFETYGEAEFRALEHRVIARMLDDPPHVLATGGGAFMNEETRRLIKDRAVSVWLRAELPVLLERVGRRNTRPLLFNKDPEQVLKQLMGERHPVYAEADHTIDTFDAPHAQTVNAVLDILGASTVDIEDTDPSNTP